MSTIETRNAKDSRVEQTRRQVLRRVGAMAAVFVGLGTMGEAAGQGANWSSLGGPGNTKCTTRPAVGRNEDGRLEVFIRGEDYALWQIWQLTAGGYSGWNSLHGGLTNTISVENNLDGRLEVFVRGDDNSLFHRGQTTPNGDWSEYARLNGFLTSAPTVARNWDGRLEVFVSGTDSAIWHIWQTKANTNAWSGWLTLPVLPDSRVTSNIAVAHGAGGGLQLFWRGPDNHLFTRRQLSANSEWEDTRRLGGPIIASDPSVGQYEDDRLAVFVRSTDNLIWQRTQTQPNSSTWTAWTPLGGPIKFTGNVTVGSNWDGRLELFARGTDNALYHTWQSTPNGGWSGWYTLGGVLSRDPAVGTNLGGRLEVFGVGGDGALWHRWQVTPGGAWN